MFYAPELVVIAVTMVAGWSALWPVRGVLGALGYHVAAFPIGLLGWSTVAVVSTLGGTPFDPPVMFAGMVAFIVLVQALLRAVARGPRTASGPSFRSYLLTGAGMVVAAWLAAASRLTVVSGDSWGEIWPYSMGLAREGLIAAEVVATRGVLLVAVGAATTRLGGEWAYVTYPLLGAWVILLLFALLMAGPFRNASGAVRIVVGIALTAFLLTSPAFIFQSLFVQAHMASALYLLLSLGAIWMAGRCATDRRAVGSWLVVAGLAAAGLALARPDGLAYVFVPVAAALALVSEDDANWRADLAFFGPLLAMLYGVYGAAFFANGVWLTTKLNGVFVLAILEVLSCLAILPSLLRSRIGKRMAPRLKGAHFAQGAVLACAALLVIVCALSWQAATLTWANTWVNLFTGVGGYGTLWWSLTLLVGLSVLSGDALRRDSSTRGAFTSMVLFWLIAALVHVTMHTGRLGVIDSFNRVAFQVVPLILWYLGMVLGRVLWDMGVIRAAGE